MIFLKVFNVGDNFDSRPSQFRIVAPLYEKFIYFLFYFILFYSYLYTIPYQHNKVNINVDNIMKK